MVFRAATVTAALFVIALVPVLPVLADTPQERTLQEAEAIGRSIAADEEQKATEKGRKVKIKRIARQVMKQLADEPSKKRKKEIAREMRRWRDNGHGDMATLGTVAANMAHTGKKDVIIIGIPPTDDD